MAGSPFRDRRIPPDEVRRIVKRAAELALVDADLGQGEALSEAELAQRLGQLGVSAEHVRRAMSPPGEAAAAAPDGVTRVTREIELDGMLGPEHHEAIAEAITSAMGTPGRVSVVGNKITWTPGGMLMEPSVTVHAKDGRTRVRYVEALANRGQQIIGFGTLAGLAGIMAGSAGSILGVAITQGAALAAQPALPLPIASAAALGVGAAVGTFFGLRRALKRRVAKRSVFADGVVTQVATAVRAALAADKAGVRVETEPAHEEEEVAAERPDDARSRRAR